ncbi:MAG: hypothetical protein M3Y17_12160 [Actinomycetota bacterium]|nr:hypothetical protein [Actinomycetota bacterium]
MTGFPQAVGKPHRRLRAPFGLVRLARVLRRKLRRVCFVLAPAQTREPRDGRRGPPVAAGRRVEDAAAAEGVRRGHRTDDNTVAPGGDDRLLEADLPEAVAQPDHSAGGVSCPVVNLNPLPVAGRSPEVERAVENHRWLVLRLSGNHGIPS